MKLFRKKRNKNVRADRDTDTYPTPEAFKVEQERVHRLMNRWFR